MVYYAADYLHDQYWTRERVGGDLAGIGPPGVASARKLQALDAFARMMKVLDRPLPTWWSELRRAVQAGRM